MFKPKIISLKKNNIFLYYNNARGVFYALVYFSISLFHHPSHYGARETSVFVACTRPIRGHVCRSVGLSVGLSADTLLFLGLLVDVVI